MQTWLRSGVQVHASCSYPHMMLADVDSLMCYIVMMLRQIAYIFTSFSLWGYTFVIKCILRRFHMVLHKSSLFSLEFPEKNCSTLSAPTNGMVTYSPVGDTTCGSNATYSCNVGYQLSTSGDETRYCGEDAVWNGTAKNCSSKRYRIRV